MTISELKQKRAALIEEIRSVQSRSAQGQSRSSDLGIIEAIEADVAQLEAEAAQIESQRRHSARVADRAARVPSASRQAEAYRSWQLHGCSLRDVSADILVEGGAIVPPQEMVSEILRQLGDMVFVRQLATVKRLRRGATGGVGTFVADTDDANWTSETQGVIADTGISFGKRVLSPHSLSKLVKVSLKFLSQSAEPGELIVGDALADKFAKTEEKAFMIGSGAGQPLGMFAASASGISTGRDYSTGNTSGAIVADNIVGQVYNIKGEYRAKAVWVFHGDAIKQVRLLKEGTTNAYIFQPALMEGQPDLLLGKPVYTSEYAPNTFTTGLYVGLFGDLRKYCIVDQLDLAVQRLEELYAATNQIGFIGSRSLDAGPVDELAFSRVKLG